LFLTASFGWGRIKMKIIHLKRNDRVYRCNSYLILGDWNRPGDVNTIIDPGNDAFVLREIERLSSGFGRLPVTQVILTHNPGDHTGASRALKERFNARILSYADGAEIDELLNDGQIIKAGDDVLEVLHTPGHSPDSICLYAPSEKALFSGDTELLINMPDGNYGGSYVEALLKIACRDILKIYSSHEQPVTRDCQDLIIQSVRTICHNSIVDTTPEK
jgi:glyoxylase-like metal-dependent hydrolase (beta-lactamase superfamily II)